MKVILEGITYPVGQVNRLLQAYIKSLRGSQLHDLGFDPERDIMTPEILSAAFARTSRSQKTIEELVAEASVDIPRARKSNEKIVFGVGHASIAEHVGFNFVLQGISRLAIRALQRHRLVSFTEKSMRYVSFNEEYFIPEELGRHNPHASCYIHQVEQCFRDYKALQGAIKSWDLRQGVDDGAAERLANEDARYVLPIATLTKTSMTINGRNLEYMIRRLRGSPLLEVRDIGDKLYSAAYSCTPSLLRYVDSKPCQVEALKEVKIRERIRLVSATRDPDGLIAERLGFRSLGEITSYLTKIGSCHELPGRQFELVNFVFDIVISNACFDQLKRHRMMSIISNDSEVMKSFVIPDRVMLARKKTAYCAAMMRCYHTRKQIALHNPSAALYLTQLGFNKRVTIGVNLRELYHIAHHRLDKDAQWEIRGVTQEICQIVKEIAPYSAAMLCGKDEFDNQRRNLIRVG